MIELTKTQHDECCRIFFQKDIFDFDPVLLDERDDNGNILTVLKYDEETILIQSLTSKGVFTYNKIPNEEFLEGRWLKS